MVSRVEEAVKKQQQQPQPQPQLQPQQKQNSMVNKGKAATKFKRSISNLEEDGASSAILFLACIACTTPSYA